MKRIAAATALTVTAVTAFTPSPTFRPNTNTALQMGLFDGMKDAFSAPASTPLDAERETPIDRWMGWNSKSEQTEVASGTKVAADFIDSMDEANYISASLAKPMGIVFEENDEEFGGIFVLSLSEGGAAEVEGSVKPGDQLVAVNEAKVSGFAFDDALGTIIDSEAELTNLTFFRGSEKQLYGPTGASKEWLDEFIAPSTNVEA
jgi:hypothetical protein